MKPKAHRQFFAALAIATLLLAGSFWVNISLRNPSQPVENQPVVRNSAMEAARQILSTLPATTVQKAAPAAAVKP